MIFGMTHKDMSVRHELMLLKWNFFLTGSRYFKTHNDKSDWDFFVQPDNETQLTNYLEHLKFKRLPFETYRDDLITAVYRNWDHNIDIQVVKDAGIKLNAQRYIATNPTLMLMMKKLNKGEINELWNLAFAAVKGHTAVYYSYETNDRVDNDPGPNFQELTRGFIEV